ncbi:MAG: hypothetical protein E6Q32_03280 [Neisseriales bacterium]|nr:MAG: hypothetical protein E6Q32_03280 [Neisseriales bacterium]
MIKTNFFGYTSKDAEIKIDTITGEKFVFIPFAMTSGTDENPRTELVDVIVENEWFDVASKIKAGTKLSVEGIPKRARGFDKEQNIITKLVCNTTFLEFLDHQCEV